MKSSSSKRREFRGMRRTDVHRSEREMKRNAEIGRFTKPSIMTGNNRANLKPGMRVFIVTKKDQRSQHLTEGTVKNILTKSATHPHGIKVRLESGEVGRVKEIVIKTTNE